jgi:hypothetical protein
VNIGWNRRLLWRSAAVGLSTEQLQARLDVRVRWVELGRALIGIQGIRDLVVARLVLFSASVCVRHCKAQWKETHQSAEIVPNLGDPRIEPNRTRIRVESVPVLVDLVVEHTDRAPEGGIAAIAIHSLLVGFVGLVVLLHLHVAAAEEVPALRIRLVYDFRLVVHLIIWEVREQLTSSDGLLEVLNGALLAVRVLTLSVMKPAKLLQNLGMVRVTLKHPVVGDLRILKLKTALVSGIAKLRVSQHTSFCCSWT